MKPFTCAAIGRMTAQTAALITAVLLSACGSTRQGQYVFPASVSNQGYGSMGLLSPSVGSDPAEQAAINPFDPIALNNLAVAEAGRGRYQQASSLLQRAVKLAPARADIAANLASLQRWLAQAEGQAALGMTPQPLQLPYQEAAVPELPALWMPSTESQTQSLRSLTQPIQQPSATSLIPSVPAQQKVQPIKR